MPRAAGSSSRPSRHRIAVATAAKRKSSARSITPWKRAFLARTPAGKSSLVAFRRIRTGERGRMDWSLETDRTAAFDVHSFKAAIPFPATYRRPAASRPFQPFSRTSLRVQSGRSVAPTYRCRWAVIRHWSESSRAASAAIRPPAAGQSNQSFSSISVNFQPASSLRKV